MTSTLRALFALALATTTSLTFAGTLVVRQDGAGGAFTTIQSAIDAATAGDILSVEDSAIYTENLNFTTSSLTLAAAPGMTPTINLTGSVAPSNRYISASMDLTTIDGFTIAFTGTPDPNVFMVLGGSHATMRNCTVIGAGTGTTLRGLGNIATLENVEIKNLDQGLIYDSATLVGEIKNCYIHDNTGHNSFSKGTIAITATVFERVRRAVYTSSISTANVTLTSCTLTQSTDRNVIRVAAAVGATSGTVTFNECTLSGGAGDLMLLQGGTTNLNRCLLIDTPLTKRCIIIDGTATGTRVNVDHCNLVSSADQWAVINNNAIGDNVITVRNSVITGFQGLHDATGFTWIVSDYNDIFCTDSNYSGSTVPGVHDISADPWYVQTSDPLAADHFVLRPFSPCAFADEFGQAMGARGVQVLPPFTAARAWTQYQ